MADLEVIRILEDPAVPKSVANRVFRAPGSVLVVAWSPYRWRDAAKEWEARTGKRAPRRIPIKETEEARWRTAERHAFPGNLTAYLSAHPAITLLVVADDFVRLPAGMPGGHIFQGEPAGYCSVCKLWHDRKGPGC